MFQENDKGPVTSLSLTLEPGEGEGVGRFFSHLRPGFTVRARVSCSIRELLCDQFGLAPDYLTRRITTIFLNHKAIDDPASSRVSDGAVLALSAAMPGLVGATMRCGGYYAAMRSAINHSQSGEAEKERSGEIVIKLFNLLMAELAPGFLRQGVLVSATDLAGFLAGQPPTFWEECREVRLNGRPTDLLLLKAGDWLSRGEESVELFVTFEE